MAKKGKLSADEAKNILEQANAQAKKNIELLEQEMNSLSRIFDYKKRSTLEYEKSKNVQQIINNYHDLEVKATERGLKIHGTTLKKLQEQRKVYEKNHKLVEKTVKNQKLLNELMTFTTNTSKNLWRYLMDSDKAIKSTALELGLSGERSQTFRENIEATAGHAARLGVSVEELTKAGSAYADETGRVKDLTAQTLESITNIGKGTALGVEQAAKLVGQYNLMGVNATQTAEHVQNIVDTTERMGLNTGKVLKKLNENFKKLQTYSFQQGVKGFAEMAAYAEKFKVDMDQTLNSADKARTLEGAVELASQLQIMGGEFAKTDPFELLFLSRNDPAAYTKKINEMTKGIATFKKNAEGTLETYISPQDLDRLSQVEKALGMQSGELSTQARRMAEIQKMRQQMMSTGLNENQTKLIEGLAEMGDDGTFTVKVGNDIKKLSELTKNDVISLEKQAKSLKERAEASQTVEDAFKNTIMELKTSLLPILKSINQMLTSIKPYVEKVVDFLTNQDSWGSTMFKVVTGLMAAGALWKGILSMPIIGTLLSKGGGAISSMMGGGAKGAGGGGGMSGGMSGSQMLGQGKGAMAAGKGAGLSALGKGAGVGVAAVGIGGGIAIAAKGIASLADSLSKLDEKQLASLEKIALGLGVAIPIMAGGMLLLGKAAEVSVVGIGILTLAVVGIGAGIGMATAGIGAMAEGMSTLLDAANPMDVLKMAGGMTALAGASLLFANPLSMVGLAGMSASVLAMSKAGPGMEQVGSAFENIGVVLQGSSSQLKEVKETIQAIAASEVGSNSALSGLASLLSKPLKVEFANKEVGFVAKIDVNMDGQKMFDTMNVARKVEIRQTMFKEGKSAPRKT